MRPTDSLGLLKNHIALAMALELARAAVQRSPVIRSGARNLTPTGWRSQTQNMNGLLMGLLGATLVLVGFFGGLHLLYWLGGAVDNFPWHRSASTARPEDSQAPASAEAELPSLPLDF